MNEKTEDEKVRAVEKTLGEPVFPELSANAWRIRTNLIVAAVVAIAVVLGDLRIDPDSTVLGLKFSGITDDILRKGLLLIIVYLTFHYLWVTFDGFLEWRVRITGTRVSFVTTGKFASEHGDYPNNPQQSTLYGWWVSEAKKIGNLALKLPEIEQTLKTLEADLRAKYTSDADAMTILNACRPLAEIQKNVADLRHMIEAAQKTILAQRIPVSLARFDRCFRLFLRSQNLRWLAIDLVVPFSLAGYAIYLLCFK